MTGHTVTKSTVTFIRWRDKRHKKHYEQFSLLAVDRIIPAETPGVSVQVWPVHRWKRCWKLSQEPASISL